MLYEHFYKRLDVNSLIYDKRMHEFRSDHFFQFLRFANEKEVFDLNTKSVFLSLNTRNALYWILNFADYNYISRLNETKEQMLKANNIIINYLSD